MILRKCRTENPAISAALGISKNIRFVAVPSVALMPILLTSLGNACCGPTWNDLAQGRFLSRLQGRHTSFEVGDSFVQTASLQRIETILQPPKGFGNHDVF